MKNFLALEFKQPMTGEKQDASQVGGEISVGLELRLTRWLALTGDIGYHGYWRVEGDTFDPTFGSGSVPNQEVRGLARVNHFDSAFNARIGLAFRF